MIRPASFGYNAETATTNAFQRRPAADEITAVHARALEEFDSAVEALRSSRVEVLVFNDTERPRTPDAVFPNNWISFHSSGHILLYPMLTASRRAEVRSDIVERVAKQFGFRTVVDLREQAHRGSALEGTGSLVLDRIGSVAYASRSERTDEREVLEAVRRLGYELVLFSARDPNGQALYHTNVVMTVGDRFAVVCLQSIADVAERTAVTTRLESTGHEIVDISPAQMMQFAGNMLQLRNTRGESLLAMSATARASLSPAQKKSLEGYSAPVTIPLPTIERYGGGSIRCMIAEVFLPQS
jgi:hypothetical protein